MKFIHKLGFVLVGVLSSLAVYVSAASSLSNEIPEDAAIKTENFTVERSLKSLNLISESLGSLKGIITKSENEEIIILNNFKHTDWEMQNIGIPNSLSTIEGTLRYQQYLISKLKYEQAMNNSSTLSALKTELKKKLAIDKKNFEKYQNSVRRVD